MRKGKILAQPEYHNDQKMVALDMCAETLYHKNLQTYASEKEDEPVIREKVVSKDREIGT